jgi:hypothetical protein
MADRPAKLTRAFADVSKKNPLVVSGQGSKVVELDLVRGAYRMNWTAQGSGYFQVKHECGLNWSGEQFINSYAENPDQGEKVVRIGESGRHTFGIDGANRIWELTFALLRDT